MKQIAKYNCTSMEIQYIWKNDRKNMADSTKYNGNWNKK